MRTGEAAARRFLHDYANEPKDFPRGLQSFLKFVPTEASGTLFAHCGWTPTEAERIAAGEAAEAVVKTVLAVVETFADHSDVVNKIVELLCTAAPCCACCDGKYADLVQRIEKMIVDAGIELPPKPVTTMLLMFHDDHCGELLDSDGKCPKCDFHPDMQSTGFRDVPEDEIHPLRVAGRTFLMQYRKPLR